MLTRRDSLVQAASHKSKRCFSLTPLAGFCSFAQICAAFALEYEVQKRIYVSRGWFSENHERKPTSPHSLPRVSGMAVSRERAE